MSGKIFIYKHIENYLLDLIRINENNKDYILPSEKQLTAKFGVSRITVRKAFEALEKKNLIYRVKAKGTFINPDKSQHKADFSENLCFILPNTITRFCNGLIDGAKAFCNENRINLLLGITDNDMQKESVTIENFVSLGCKGILVMPSDYGFYNEKLMELSLKKFPIVLVDKVLKRLNLSSVSSDHYKAVSDVMKLLYTCGHTKITYVTKYSEASSSVADRNRAFEQALLQYYGSITGDNFLYLDNASSPAQIEAEYTKFFKANRPHVIMINSGDIAVLLIKTLKNMGFDLGKDFVFVLFDEEFTGLVPFMGINAYNIVQDTFRIGYLAAQQLYRQTFFGEPPKSIKVDAKVTR